MRAIRNSEGEMPRWQLVALVVTSPLWMTALFIACVLLAIASLFTPKD